MLSSPVTGTLSVLIATPRGLALVALAAAPDQSLQDALDEHLGAESESVLDVPRPGGAGGSLSVWATPTLDPGVARLTVAAPLHGDAVAVRAPMLTVVAFDAAGAPTPLTEQEVAQVAFAADTLRLVVYV